MDVALLDDWAGAALSLADWSGVTRQGRVQVFTDHVTDPDALVERLRGFDAVVLMRERTPFGSNVVERLPRLRLIVTTGRRNPVLDFAAAARRGVLVTNTGSLATGPGELTWALILAAQRSLVDEVAAVGEGRWQSTVGRDLAGSTLGVVGLGRIGRHVARVGAAFGMTVLAHSRTLTTEAANDVGAVAVSLAELARRSDVVTVHVPLSASTRGLVSEGFLGSMPPGALLVNTSRWDVVETAALRSALEDGRLRAAFDVWDHEPLPADDPWRTMPGMLASPHLGYVTRSTLSVFYREAVENIEAFLAGAPVRVVEPDA